MNGMPLADCVVLDLTQFLAGPYCTQVLADLGARVIKIEPPYGDSTREMPPHYVDGISAYFLSTNRSKESVTIDLKSEEGRRLVLDLAAKSEIVVENFRPGVMERLGLQYEELAARNPSLVLCSISGFGQAGPYSRMPAYDLIVQALSGVMSLTGEPGGIPVRTGVPLGDLAAGLLGAIGAIAALTDARTNGRGSHVDVSLLDGQISLLTYLALYYLVSGEVAGPQGRDHVSIPTYRAFQCADGREVVVTANTENMWRQLCVTVGRPDLVDDPRFETNVHRNEHRDVLAPLLEAAFATRDAADWVEALREAGVPVAPINTIDQALHDRHATHREMVTTVHRPGGEDLRLLGNPIKYIGRAQRDIGPPPRLGEHTAAILREFVGLQEEDLDDLVARTVIGMEPGKTDGL